MKYIVYLTINLKSYINGLNKIYIGVHQTENPDIFDGYIGCGVYIQKPSTYMYPKTPFQYAVKKYGVTSFKRITLHIYDNQKDAFIKENEIVDLNFINLPHTYNIAIGGIGGSLYKQDPEWHTKPLYQFDLQGNLIKEWDSTLQASDFYNELYQKFDWAITDHTILLNSIWSRSKQINIELYKNINNHLTYVYTKDGKLLTVFSSRKNCSEFLNCTQQAVSKAINTESILKNYYVSNKLVDEFVPKERKQLKNSLIYIYDVNGNFIGQGIGKEIMSIINLHSYKSIWSAIYSNNGWYKDYYLSLTKVDKVPEKLHTNRKKIDIYDIYGNFIETLESLKDVKTKYNINSAELSRLLKGVKNHKQYIFKYNSK